MGIKEVLGIYFGFRKKFSIVMDYPTQIYLRETAETELDRIRREYEDLQKRYEKLYNLYRIALSELKKAREKLKRLGRGSLEEKTENNEDDSCLFIGS